MTQTEITPSVIARLSQAARYVVSGATPQSWFGADKPVSALAPASVEGRRFDYPVGYNLTSSPRSESSVSFEDLRALADNCDILRSVIETRKDQMEALSWRIRLADGTAPTASQAQRINTITRFFQNPDKETGFSGWLRQILEDMFVIDAACIYKRRTRAGGLYALEVIDGATIKILIDDSGRLPLSPNPAYQQILKGVPAVDYTRDELLYLKHNPRSHKIYGYSHVEQVMITINILIRRALHQLEYYREGSQPDAFIGLPKEWNQEQILAFQKHFDAMLAGNSSLRRRLRFMPGDFKYQETKAPPLKDAYDEFLARIICYVFSVSPEPFVSHVNRATAQVSQKRGTDEGLAPLQRYVSGSINRIIAEEFDSPDLEFAWQDGVEQDPAEAAKINVAYVQAGILSAAEVRQSLGLERGEAEVQKSGSLEVRKYNSRHKPAGNPEGGQFDVADGSEDAASDSASSTTGSEVIDSVFSGLQTLLGSLSNMLSGLQDALSGSEEGSEETDGDFTADDNVSNEAAPTASARQTIRTKTRSTDLSGYTQLAADEGIQSDAVPESWGGNPARFEDHYERHGTDFGVTSADEYADKANEFLKQGYTEKLPMVEHPNGGEISVYDPATNSYGLYTADGKTVTYYKPTSPDYFERKSADAISRGGRIINPLQANNVLPETSPEIPGFEIKKPVPVLSTTETSGLGSHYNNHETTGKDLLQE